jgi:hypothetical protein
MVTYLVGIGALSLFIPIVVVDERLLFPTLHYTFQPFSTFKNKHGKDTESRIRFY